MSWFKKISYHEAEKLEGRRLDRRRKYYKKTEDGLKATRGINANPWGFPNYEKAFTLDFWSEECSGCSGGGCFECGNHGKRCNSMYFPVTIQEYLEGVNSPSRPNSAKE